MDAEIFTNVQKPFEVYLTILKNKLVLRYFKVNLKLNAIT